MNDIISRLFSEEESTIKVLDHGYVRLVDCMPRVLKGDEFCDTAVVDMARVSYQAGTVRKRSDEGLLRYLMRHQHTSPFEGIEFKFEIRLPLFIQGQMVRHRTASLNQESARYSKMRGDFYIPESLRQQSEKNKQATDDDSAFDPELTAEHLFEGTTAVEAIEACSIKQYATYEAMLEENVAREQARMILPQNLYTSMVWKMDLKNLLHFLKLRLDSHAQYEIRVYAEAIYEFVKKLCPWTAQAFEDYMLNAITLSVPEQKIMAELFRTGGLTKLKVDTALELTAISITQRELDELSSKLTRFHSSLWNE